MNRQTLNREFIFWQSPYRKVSLIARKIFSRLDSSPESLAYNSVGDRCRYHFIVFISMADAEIVI